KLWMLHAKSQLTQLDLEHKEEHLVSLYQNLYINHQSLHRSEWIMNSKIIIQLLHEK
ncbi:hypothetical protein ALC62_02682, partial [Cyphomyrmex costatus]